MTVDAHCHVIVKEMTSSLAPDDWRPAISRRGGRSGLRFRGREIDSVTGEFSDVATMLGQAAAAGVDHLLLSPWISLVPVTADLAVAQRVCELQNIALAAIVASSPGRVSAVGAVRRPPAGDARADKALGPRGTAGPSSAEFGARFSMAAKRYRLRPDAPPARR